MNTVKNECILEMDIRGNQRGWLEVKKDKSYEDNDLEMIREELCQAFKNPSDMTLGCEKDRFQRYCHRWHEQKKLFDIWDNAAFFPLSYSKGFFPKMKKLCAEDREGFMEVLAALEVPYVLDDILTMHVRTNGWDSVLEIFRSCGPCRTGDSIFSEEVDGILAPAALGVLMQYVLRNVDSTVEAAGYAKQISEVLQGRTDGFYLSYHYVKYLLWKDSWGNRHYGLPEILSEGFAEEAEKHFVINGRIRVEGLESISEDAVGDFAATGILNNAGDADVLLNFRALMRFLPEEGLAEEFWRVFKTVYSCDAHNFITHGIDFRLKHLDICELILSQRDIPGAWKETGEMMKGALHRLSFQYYGDRSMDLRSHVEFMWMVSLRIMDNMDREDRQAALAVWNGFWKDGLSCARRFARFQTDSAYQYLCRLIYYYFVCFVKDGCSEEEGRQSGKQVSEGQESREQAGRSQTWLDELMPLFREIENMPILVLLSVSMLLNNGLTWDDVMGSKYQGFFDQSFRRARELAAEQKKYQWVERYLKKKRFYSEGGNAREHTPLQ